MVFCYSVIILFILMLLNKQIIGGQTFIDGSKVILQYIDSTFTAFTFIDGGKVNIKIYRQ